MKEYPADTPLDEFIIGKWVGTKDKDGQRTSYKIEFTNSGTLIMEIKHPNEEWTDVKYNYVLDENSELAKWREFEHHFEKETGEYIGEGWLRGENYRLKNEWEIARLDEHLLIGFYDVEYFVVFEREND